MTSLAELSKAAFALPLAHRTILSEYLWDSIHGASPAPINLSAVDDVLPDAQAFCNSKDIVEQMTASDLEKLAIVAENAMTFPFDERFQLAQEAWQSIHDFAETWPVDDETVAEIERRYAEMERGEAEMISHEDVMTAVRKAIRGIEDR